MQSNSGESSSGLPCWRHGKSIARHLAEVWLKAGFPTRQTRSGRSIPRQSFTNWSAQRLGILGAEALSDYARARGSVVVLLQDLLHNYLLPGRLVVLGLSLALTVLATILARRTHWPALLATVWLTAVAYVALVALVTVVLRRYMAPFDFLVWLEMGLAVIAIADVQAKRKPYHGLVTQGA
jgi:hypothetical protein